MNSMIYIMTILGVNYVVLSQINMSQDMFHLSFVGLLIIEYVVYMLYIKQYYKSNDRLYYYRSWFMGSYPNYFGLTEGNRWTPSFIVKQKMKGDLEVDRFRFDYTVRNRFRWYSLGKYFEDFKCSIKSKSLVYSAIVFGQMGAGKSEFYYWLITQNTCNRYFLYDSKGDFTQMLFKSKRDIILNPYDERTSFWNPFEEAQYSEQVIEIFMTNLFNAIAGDKKDFFSSSSRDRYMTIFNEIAYLHKDKNPKEKFNMFIEELNLYFDEVAKMDRGSEKDVVSTMQLTFKFFEYMNFCIQKEDSKTFTITEFLKSKNSKLFLLDREEYKATLKPFYTAFIATFSAILLSKEDNKEDLTMFGLDEFLTFAKNIDDDILEGMFTRLRSKGGCLLPGVQYFPTGGKNEELTQKLLNSASYFFLFQGIDTYTLERINKTIGKTKYKQQSPSSKKDEERYQVAEADLLNVSIFQSLGEKFEHITFIPKNKILYKGYTPQAKLKKVNESFIRSSYLEEYWIDKKGPDFSSKKNDEELSHTGAKANKQKTLLENQKDEVESVVKFEL